MKIVATENIAPYAKAWNNGGQFVTVPVYRPTEDGKFILDDKVRVAGLKDQDDDEQLLFVQFDLCTAIHPSGNWPTERYQLALNCDPKDIKAVKETVSDFLHFIDAPIIVPYEAPTHRYINGLSIVDIKQAFRNRHTGWLHSFFDSHRGGITFPTKGGSQ